MIDLNIQDFNTAYFYKKVKLMIKNYMVRYCCSDSWSYFGVNFQHQSCLAQLCSYTSHPILCSSDSCHLSSLPYKPIWHVQLWYQCWSYSMVLHSTMKLNFWMNHSCSQFYSDLSLRVQGLVSLAHLKSHLDWKETSKQLIWLMSFCLSLSAFFGDTTPI